MPATPVSRILSPLQANSSCPPSDSTEKKCCSAFQIVLSQRLSTARDRIESDSRRNQRIGNLRPPHLSIDMSSDPTPKAKTFPSDFPILTNSIYLKIRLAVEEDRPEDISALFDGLPDHLIAYMICEKLQAPLFFTALCSCKRGAAFFGSLEGIALAIDLAIERNNSEMIQTIWETIPSDLTVSLFCEKAESPLFFKSICHTSRGIQFLTSVESVCAVIETAAKQLKNAPAMAALKKAPDRLIAQLFCEKAQSYQILLALRNSRRVAEFLDSFDLVSFALDQAEQKNNPHAIQAILADISDCILIELLCEKSDSPLFVNAFRSSGRARELFGSQIALCTIVDRAELDDKSALLQILIEDLSDAQLKRLVYRMANSPLFFEMFCSHSRSKNLPTDVAQKLLLHHAKNGDLDVISSILSSQFACKLSQEDFKQAGEALRNAPLAKIGDPAWESILSELSRAISAIH